MAEYNAGAGRGKQGGPTAKELDDYERKLDAGIYTADKGKPPQDKDSGSAPVKKLARGGMTAPRGQMGGRSQMGPPPDMAARPQMGMRPQMGHPQGMPARPAMGARPAMAPQGMKKGGMTASKRADGIATKGKTRGTMVTMKNGGSC